MKITYRDELGLIAVDVDTEYGICFDGSYAYFSDTYGMDYRISADMIVMIGKESVHE